LTAVPRVLAVGDAAVSVEFGDTLDPVLNACVRGLDRALAAAPVPGQIESVPSHRALLVLYEPGVVRFVEIRDELLRRAAAVVPSAAEPGAPRSVPTRYGGTDGPDLARVAARLGLTEAEVVRLHASGEYTAFMLGFMPGFAYLGMLPEALATPRLETPRVRVPAGSVAIAGRQTGIYPVASPGGWNVIGRTSLRLFDPAADPPARILPGDRVRFVASQTLPEPPPTTPPPTHGAPAVLEILEPGLLTTVQDAGRRGYRRLGVSWAGALDAPALRAANALLGNDPQAAALECTLAGPALRFLATTHFAVTGADLSPVLQREDLGAWPVPAEARILARAGNILRFSGRRWGCRAYLAVAGGIDVPPLLGSRSTDLGSGFGGFAGRALRAGDRLAVGQPPGLPPTSPERPTTQGPADPALVRVVLGPQHQHLDPASLIRFLAEPYAVSAASDRVGCRLAGPPLAHRGAAEIVSDGMSPGSIQVPPDGQPIVMLADGPTTGGYPKVATVVSADLPRLAQLVPGVDTLRFVAVGPGEA